MQRLKAGLDAAGLTTWFDLDRLEGGDDYDRKIHANIGRCSFFLPVISATTQRRLESVFPARVELCGGSLRATSPRARSSFCPVCIDGTPEAEALVPDKFKSVHISRLLDGEPTPDFLRRLQDLCSARRS